ncbi:MAG: hypothetical protein ACRD1Z_23120 [Vicinamibacteria bacterium]
MSEALSGHIERLTELFRRSGSKHEAHLRSQDVLKEMASDPSVLAAVFEKYLARPGVLNSSHYPVIGIEIELNPHYGLVANCWIPLPDRRTDVSTKAIHHHGEMLLTTVTAFGPGYEHWTFSRPSLADPERELFTLSVLEREPHPLGHAAFVDAYVPHLPLYPGALTITLALWSHRSHTSWKDRVKRLPFLKGREAALRKLGVGLGLSRALDLKVVHYFDFCPSAGGFRGLSERTEFERGPNSDFLYSLFHVLQRTRHPHLAARIESQLKSAEGIENRELVESLLRDLRLGRDIEGRLSVGHFDQPSANFTKDEIARALASV